MELCVCLWFALTRDCIAIQRTEFNADLWYTKQDIVGFRRSAQCDNCGLMLALCLLSSQKKIIGEVMPGGPFAKI